MPLAEKPAFNKAILCAKLHAKSSGSKKKRRVKFPEDRVYLEICVTHHLVFIDMILENIHEVDIYLTGH